MKVLIFVISVAALCFVTAAHAGEGADKCRLVAQQYYLTAVNRDKGVSYADAWNEARIRTNAVNSADREVMAEMWFNAVKRTYATPEVQPEVWFGYELAMCEASLYQVDSTQGDFGIFPAPQN